MLSNRTFLKISFTIISASISSMESPAAFAFFIIICFTASILSRLGLKLLKPNMSLSLKILYSELKKFLKRLDIISLNSFAPTFKFLPCKTPFLKTVIPCLTLNKASVNMLILSFLIPNSSK